MHTSLLISVMILLHSAGLLQNKSAQSNRPGIPIELWCGGDDVLTKGVCKAAYTALDASPDFDFVDADSKKPGTLVVAITENVEWEEIGTRTKVSYKVEFTSIDEKKLGDTKGSCWDDDFAVCGAQILNRARTVARKMNSKH